jgi:hypothetical protein
MAQNTAALCAVWCEPDLADAAGCHDQGSPAAAEIGHDECSSMAVGATALVGPELRRAASPADQAQAAIVRGVLFVYPSFCGGHDRATSQHTAHAGGPVVSPLRI